MRRKFNLVDLVILTTIASTTLYIIFRNLPRLAGSFSLLWAPASLLLIMILRPRTYLKQPVSPLLIYGLLFVGILQYTLWKYMMDFNRIRILYEWFYLIVFVSIWSYYLRMRNYYTLALIGKWGFVFILITLITTNLGLFIDPSIVRDSANSAKFTTPQLRLFNYLGTMDYSYIQAIICLIPVLAFYIRSKRIFFMSRKVLIVILILIVVTELRSQVFANIFVTIVVTTLSFISSRNLRLTIITVLLAGMVFVTIPNSFYVNIISSISDNFDPGSVTSKKLKGIALFIEDPEIDTTTDIGRRAARYPLLINALSSNPFFGHSSYASNLNIGAGAHLYWMNRLAIWGIPGFLFFIFVLYKVFRIISLSFDRGFRFYYFLSLMSVFLLGLTKAVGGREPWLILIIIIPGMYYIPLLSPKKGRSDINNESNEGNLIR